MTPAEEIRELLERYGLTIYDIAEESGVAVSTIIQRLETGLLPSREYQKYCRAILRRENRNGEEEPLC